MTALSLKRIVFLLSATGLLGCSQGVQFAQTLPLETPSEANENPDDVTCEPGEFTVVRPTKIIFVVDQSGSNINGPYGFPGMATDPSKNFRLSVMSAFFQQHASKQHLGWGLVSFNGTSAQGIVNQGNPLAPDFTSNATDMVNGLANFAASTDVGNTPYRAALTLVRGMIQRDLTHALPNTQYLVAFITDGYPTDYCTAGPSVVDCPTSILESQLDADVQALVDVADSRIEFGTVYYGLPDSNASQRLARMASIGGGQFVDTNFASSISLDDVVSVPRPTCQQ